MRRARWLVISNNRLLKPVLFHCISRVVDRRFVFAERECEAFRMFIRMYENFSGMQGFVLLCDVESLSSLARSSADAGGWAG